MKNSGQQPWVSPLKKIPSVLVPIVRAQENHYGQILNPTRWWGRFPFLFWLIAFFVGFLERKKSAISPTTRALVMTRVSQQCECDFCIDANSLSLSANLAKRPLQNLLRWWHFKICLRDLILL